ncbi:hypothetical protein T492DRAFT_891674 [Pavlovales sp. CCMP2436]|nr:hypothetical protein T492DRAFT_891674 [Pavlovales sp. CCMP2436]
MEERLRGSADRLRLAGGGSYAVARPAHEERDDNGGDDGVGGGDSATRIGELGSSTAMRAGGSVASRGNAYVDMIEWAERQLEAKEGELQQLRHELRDAQAEAEGLRICLDEEMEEADHIATAAAAEAATAAAQAAEADFATERAQAKAGLADAQRRAQAAEAELAAEAAHVGAIVERAIAKADAEQRARAVEGEVRE